MILEEVDDEVVESKKKEKITIANKTGLAALDAIMAKVSKDLNQDLSGTDYGDVEFSSSGSIALDIALGRGGFPLGRIIEIIGDPSSGKTSFALSYIATRQKRRKELGITNKRDLIVDVEHSLETSFIKGYGVDMSQVIWIRVETVEEALTILIEYIKSGCIDTALLDSIDAMENEKMVRRAIGENDVGGMSKEMNKGLRQLAKLCPQTNTLCIFINQIKQNPGVMYGSSDTQTGGRAIIYYSAIIMKMMAKKPGPSDLPGSSTFRIKVSKTKVGLPLEEEVEIVFLLGKGIDKVYDVISIAKELGILRNSAGQPKVKWKSDQDFEVLAEDVEKGAEAASTYLRSHPKLLERLYHACLRACKITGALSDESFTRTDSVVG